MIETLSHPAQSPEFLSRLHDGELSPDEAAAFESHRRECEQCRESVTQYEGALAVYRETAVTPHASDLSSRILRKIRSASPSRRPFGVMFGIDVRWAGVLAAALLVVIIGVPEFRRRPAAVREETAPASRAPIPAYVLDAEEQKSAQTRAEPDRPARMRAAPKSESAPLAPPAGEGGEREYALAPPGTSADTERRDEIASNTATSHNTQEGKLAAPAPAPAAPSLQAASPQAGVPQAAAPQAAAPQAGAPQAGAQPVPPQQADAKERANAVTSRRQSAAAPPGGEGGSGTEDAPVAVSLAIQAADGQGEAPELVRTPSDERLAALHGRQYLLLVEVSGRVRAVEERTTDKKVAKDKSSEADEAAAGARALEASVLHELLFQAGDRSRRLLVTVRVR